MNFKTILESLQEAKKMWKCGEDDCDNVYPTPERAVSCCGNKKPKKVDGLQVKG